jgi:hypothetical protein
MIPQTPSEKMIEIEAKIEALKEFKHDMNYLLAIISFRLELLNSAFEELKKEMK